MNIIVDMNTPIADGKEVVFRSPVDCSLVTGLLVNYNGGSQEFAFADAHGNNVGDIDHLFAENVVVKVILDVTTGMAFVQNADTNAYLEGRFADIEDRIKYLPIEINSWTDVQNIVRQGIASQVFSIGDQFVCNHATFGALVWDIIGFDCEVPYDHAYTHSLTLQLHDCLPIKMEFDAAEPTNPNKHRSLYGNNNWSQSNINQWLYQSYGVTDDSWFYPWGDYDAEPSYGRELVFKRGLDADFLSVIGMVNKKTALNTVTDGGGFDVSACTFFLPSLTEVNGGLNGDVEEGKVYPYYSSFADLTGITYRNRRIKYLNGTASNWALRSPVISYSCNIKGVLHNGNFSDYNAALQMGIAPCCVIY